MKKIWIDFETSGLNPQTCGITQMAYLIEAEDGTIIDEGEFNIKPFEGAEIQSEALKITGKTYDEVMAYPDEKDVLEEFLGQLRLYVDKMNKEDNLTIGAYNASFDIDFLRAWIDRYHRNFFTYFNYHACDPLALLRILRWEGKVNLQSLKLKTVYEAIFNKELKAHDASADIRATYEVYQFLRKEYLK